MILLFSNTLTSLQCKYGYSSQISKITAIEQLGISFRLWLLPNVILKSIIFNGMNAQASDTTDVAKAVDFMTERLNRMSQQEIASRLTLNCVPCEAQAEFIDVPVTIIR